MQKEKTVEELISKHTHTNSYAWWTPDGPFAVDDGQYLNHGWPLQSGQQRKLESGYNHFTIWQKKIRSSAAFENRQNKIPFRGGGSVEYGPCFCPNLVKTGSNVKYGISDEQKRLPKSQWQRKRLKRNW